MAVKITVPCAVIIELLVPGLLQSQLSPRQKLRYFLYAMRIWKKAVLKDQQEWLDVHSIVPMDFGPFESRAKYKIEIHVLNMGWRENRKE